ncbi:VWA domain-containing protein [Arthrobacter sp. 35W]|uniref:VWA domain-containing protein n=1 Tax=Arthrobacter sp. 35W TaxID=1132441 RepID=UPI0004081EF8|nr:VWA domain-containing protein [Arthrobacter sp. 35W]
MTLLPVLPLWLMIPLALALVLLGGAAALLWRSRTAAVSANGARPASMAPAVRAAALVALVLLAALRPGFPGGTAQQISTQLNVFFVVDTTSSSNAEDFGPSATRLDGMKTDIEAIAAALPGARYSMLTFDSSAVVRLPLTTDANALDTMVDILSPEVTLFSRGSSVTVAADALKDRLEAARKAHPDRPRLVFYLGDGEQTADKAPAPFNLPENLVNGGAVLGYGTVDGGRMRENSGYPLDRPEQYITDYSTGGSKDAVSRLDEKMLRTLADQLTVPYVHRNAGDPIAAALVDASAAGMAPDDAATTAGRIELYWIFALAAFAVVLWEIVDSGRRLRRLSVRTAGRTGPGPKPEPAASDLEGMLR